MVHNLSNNVTVLALALFDAINTATQTHNNDCVHVVLRIDIIT